MRAVMSLDLFLFSRTEVPELSLLDTAFHGVIFLEKKERLPVVPK